MEVPVGIGGGGGLRLLACFLHLRMVVFSSLGGQNSWEDGLGLTVFVCVYLYVLVCICSCVCLPELQSGAECGGVTIVPRAVGRCLPGEPTLWRSWWARLVSSRIWTHAASDAKRDQVPHRHYDHPHKGAPRRKCLHRLHTLTLWSPYKTFQSTCKRELSNHFMIDINAEKLTSQPRRMIASKMLLPRSAEKGSFWSQDQRLWGLMALTRGQGGFWLHRKLEAQCAPWHICWPQINTAQVWSL